VLDESAVRIRKSWDVTYGPPVTSGEDALQQFEELLEESVRSTRERETVLRRLVMLARAAHDRRSAVGPASTSP
jgi:hypothetical protein